MQAWALRARLFQALTHFLSPLLSSGTSLNLIQSLILSSNFESKKWVNGLDRLTEHQFTAKSGP